MSDYQLIEKIRKSLREQVKRQYEIMRNHSTIEAFSKTNGILYGLELALETIQQEMNPQEKKEVQSVPVTQYEA